MELGKIAPSAVSSAPSDIRPDIFCKVDNVVIGGGQAGLSAACHNLPHTGP